MGACRECSVGCNTTIWGNGICDDACNNVDCNFDMGDCANSTCALGCNTWMVGNSICDEACYVPECEYDKTDCTCAPFCSTDLLKNGVCDELCNTFSCKFDSGDCGYCSSGCTHKMLANNICDPECNTEDCEWDYYACGCAKGCSTSDYGKCKPECLVGTCKYDRMSDDSSKWCNDKDLVLFTVYMQMRINDTSSVVNFDKCYLASNNKCNLTMALDQSKCYPDCFIPECNYGLCNTNSYADCKASLPKSAWNLCEQCTSSTEGLGIAPCNQCFSTDITCTYLNLFGISVYYSNYLSISKTFPHLSFYYATSTQKSSSPSGSGTIDSPFEAMSYAISSINADHAVLFLKNDGIYSWKDEISFGYYQYNYLKITSQDGSIVSVKVDSWRLARMAIYGSVEIENVIFDGNSTVSMICVDSIYCYYCSYNTYNSTDRYYYNDRGERASKNLLNDYCELHEEYTFNLFELESYTYCSLLLRNVTFQNFRTEQNSIISGEGKVRLFNVNFDNIRLGINEDSAIISVSVSYKKTSEPELIYIGGSVTRLNNGYEFEDPVDFRGFFYSTNITTILIRNVEFKHNLVYRKPRSQLKQASLIYTSYTNFIEIDNCTFMYNYCETGIIHALLNFLTYPGGLNETYHIPYLYKDHIYVHDSKFISNYGNSSLIDLEFSYYFLNIHFENLTFQANGIENGQAINISNAFMLDEYKNGAIKPYKLLSGMNVHAVINKRWCKMDNLSFINNHGIGLISLTNMPHLSLKNLAIQSNGSPNEDKDINTLLLNYFISNSDMYLKRKKANPKALDCEYMVSISDSYNVDICPVVITNNICRNSSPTYLIKNTDTTDINSAKCLSNKGNGVFPACFLFTGSFSRVLKNSIFDNNFNSYSTGTGAIEIREGKGLFISKCNFTENTGDYGAAIYLAGQGMVVEESVFDSNISPKGSGGALFIIQILVSGESLFKIADSNFTSNSADYGGSIYIAQQWIGSSSTEILVENSIFKLNRAFYGSALYIDSTVSLVNSSTISSSKFIENTATISGTVSLFYSKGILNFELCKFLANSGQLSSVLHVDIASSTIALTSCNFSSNTGIAVILGNNQNSFSYVETKNCIFEYNYGSAISLNYDSMEEYGSIFRHNSAVSGPCLRLQNSAIVKLNQSYLFSNTGSMYGGAILLSSNSIFFCNSCNFTNNVALEGGAIYAEQDSLISISDSLFYKNSCKDDGSTIYIFNSNRNSSINYSQIYENHSENGGTIIVINSKLSIDSLILKNNNGGFKLAISAVDILNSKFFNQSCAQGCFINLSAGSSLYIYNSIFSNGSSSDSGGAIYSSSSNILIEQSEFNHFSSVKPGGFIYSWFDNSLQIKKSKISVSSSLGSGGVIYVFLTPTVIANSIFNDYVKSGIYGSYLKELDISQSTFSNGSGAYGGGICCKTCSNVKINACSFENNTASSAGGALYFESDLDTSETNTYQIDSSSFINNSAPIGGALYANDLSLSISSASFIENKALTNESFIDSQIIEGIGGAIKLSCLGISKCSFEIISCNFTGNMATYNGGAINWDDWKPSLEKNYFMNNYAIYGNDYSSYPVKLMSVSENGTLEGYTNNRHLTDSPISIFNLSSFAPGQDNRKPIKVALVDSMNQIVATDNINLGELKSKNVSTIITGVTKVKAVRGIFTFSQYEISDEPGINVTIGVFSSAIDNYKKLQTNDTVFDQYLLIKINLRGCELGEIKAGKNCEVCGYGYYSLDPSKTQCLACPGSAECYGNYTMTPKKGYWRDNVYTDKFWKCPNYNACIGSPDPKNLSYTGLCQAGYKGNMCQSCQSGYSRANNNKCKECPSFVKNLAITIAICVALSALAFIMVLTTIKSAFKPKKLTSIYIKIMLNYLQMVILTSTFKLNWPSEVLEIFQVQSSTDYVYQQLYSFECLLQEESSRDLLYYKSLILISLLPLFMAILALIIWIIIKFKQKSFKNFWDDYCSTCIILLFLVHPGIVKKMFASFNCTEINYGEYWLEEDLDVRCWNDDHIFYILVVSLPSIIIWGILLPTVCLFALVKSRNHLKELNVRLRFGFLFNGYQLSRYYWEFIIIYSKIILICLSVFLSNMALKVQALIAAILLSIFLQLQYSNSPYIEPSLNRMELQAKIVCVITIYSGLFYLTGSLGYSAKLFFFTLIIIANCYFLVYWCLNVFKTALCYIYKYAKQRKSNSKISNDPDIEILKIEIDMINSQASNKRIENSLNDENAEGNQSNIKSIKDSLNS
ncbi:unnamed protein product [Blepharisma stoltei]|uniref:LNR domain-containing protein n=1 Tax=Blepharisma stoltei TaxID=1481888 RepID=A0AAU9J874_9CILI|nr:unnamed protein product [Blepharisma stoltei]